MKLKMAKTKLGGQILKLRGKAAVFVDWANVHGWEEKLNWRIDLEKLYRYLKSHHQVNTLRFYFGTDNHPASKEQIRKAKEIGFFVVTKPVKYLPIKTEAGIIWRRKCDFDLEIGLDCFEMLDEYESFIFFTGDGDMATLYRRLARRKKQTIVVFARGSLGKEVRGIQKGVYLCDVRKMKEWIKISPDQSRGAIQKVSPREPRGARLSKV